MTSRQPRRGCVVRRRGYETPLGFPSVLIPFHPWVAAVRQPGAIFSKPFGLLLKRRKVRNTPRGILPESHQRFFATLRMTSGRKFSRNGSLDGMLCHVLAQLGQLPLEAAGEDREAAPGFGVEVLVVQVERGA